MRFIGYQRPHQQIISCKVFVSLPTGYGKSLIYSAYDLLGREGSNFNRCFTTALANEGSGKCCVVKALC